MSTNPLQWLVAAAAVAVAVITQQYELIPAAFAVGSIIGGLIFPARFPHELDQLRVTKSAYGESIPIAYNKVRSGTQLYWASTVRAKARGHGGYEYGQDCFFGICEGAAIVHRVWLSKQLVWSDDPTDQLSNVVDIINQSTVTFPLAQVEVALLFGLYRVGPIDPTTLVTTNSIQVFTFYMGGPNQQPPQLIANELGYTNVPGYRGQTTMMIANLPLHLYGNAIPVCEVEYSTYVIPDTVPSEPATFSPLDMGTNFFTWGSVFTIPDVANNKIHTITRTGNTTNNSFANPHHWYWVDHNLDGTNPVPTAMSSVLGVSSHDAAVPITKIGNNIFASTWTSGGGSTPGNATVSVSKINMLTATETASCSVNQTVIKSGSHTQPYTACPFIVGGVNYILIIEAAPSGSPNASVINADSMSEVVTASFTSSDFSSKNPYAIALCWGTNATGTTAEIFGVWSHTGTFDFLGVTKFTFNTSGNTLSATHIDLIAASEIEANWVDFDAVAFAAWDPNDGKIVALVQADDWVDVGTALVKIDPANGDVIWVSEVRGGTNYDEEGSNAANLSNLSNGTIVIEDYYSFTEYDLTDGSIIQTVWFYRVPSYNEQSSGGFWDSANRYLGAASFRQDEVKYGGILFIPENATRSNWKLPKGGFPVFGGWHDPNEPYYYLLRETHNYKGYELAKIDADGEVVDSEFFDYATNTGNYTQIFAQSSAVIGSPDGDKLYVWTEGYISFPTKGTALIELDKATLAITTTHDYGTVTAKPNNSLSGDNMGGAQCMSKDGLYLVRLSNNTSSGSFPTFTQTGAYISVVNTSTGNLTVKNFIADFGLSGVHIDRGVFFRGTGYDLYVVLTPVVSPGNLAQSGSAQLHHLTVSESAGQPALTLVGNVTLTADDTTSYPTGNGTKCSGASYHTDTDSATIFLDKNVFSTVRGNKPVLTYFFGNSTSVHCVADFPGEGTPANYDPDKDGWAPSGHMYAQYYEEPPANDRSLYNFIELLDAQANTVTESLIWDTWSHAGVVTDAGSTCGHYDADAESFVLHTSGFSDDAIGGYPDIVYYLGEAETTPTVLPWTLRDICADQSTRVDLQDDPADLNYDVLIPYVPHGYLITTRNTARDNIEALQPAFFFDIIETNHILFARLRSDETVITTIDEGESVRVDEGKSSFFQFDRKNDKEIPRWLDFAYYDVERDHLGNTQSAERGGGTPSDRNAAKVSVPVDMLPDEAKTAADRLLRSTWAERETTAFKLPQKYLALEPADLVILTKGGLSAEVKITSNAIGVTWAIDFEAMSHDSGSYSVTAIGSTNDDYVPPSITIQSPAEQAVLDTALLSNDNDYPGLYVVPFPTITPEAGGLWSSGTVQKSADQVTYADKGIIFGTAKKGHATNSLGNTTQFCTWDTVSTVRVQLDNAVTLSSMDRTLLVADKYANLTFQDGELYQWSTATFVSTGVWDLTDLLRGRFGTESFVGTHASSEEVIFLAADEILDVPFDASEIGLTRYYRTETDSSTPHSDPDTVVQAAIRLKPWAPWYIQATRTLDVINGTFQRRSRLAPTVPLNEPPIDAAFNGYEIDVYNGASIVRTITSTPSANGSVVNNDRTWVYDDGDQTTDFGSVQASVHVKVYELSTVFGRGYAGDATV